MATRVLIVDEDGSVEALWAPDVRDLAAQLGGAVRKRRASHVEPARLWKRLAFRLVRRAFRDESAFAEWTRVWRGPWRVRIMGGPTLLGEWMDRAEAIRAEVEWLQDRM